MKIMLFGPGPDHSCSCQVSHIAAAGEDEGKDSKVQSYGAGVDSVKNALQLHHQHPPLNPETLHPKLDLNKELDNHLLECP